MALTAVANRVLQHNAISVSSGAYGVVAQRDGSYLFGITETSDNFPFPTSSSWYRSTDNGTTWAHVGDATGMLGQTYAFPTNQGDNVITAPWWDGPTNAVGIQRSLDGGVTWTDVFTAAIAGSPNGRSVTVRGTQSYGQTKGIAWGELDGNKGNPPKIYGLTTNRGATWTVSSSPDIGNSDDIANACGIAEDGTIYLQYTKFGGAFRVPGFARSDDGGISWTVLTPPSGGAGSPPNFTIAICCFDKTHIVLAGAKGHSGGNAQPGIWWSDDAGVTLHILSSADVTNWPTTSGNVYSYEIKRLTRDACLLAFEQQTGSAGSPWRISTDQGHTFPVEVTAGVGGFETYQVPYGKAVMTRDGGILAPVWQSPDYNNATVALYKIALSC